MPEAVGQADRAATRPYKRGTRVLDFETVRQELTGWSILAIVLVGTKAGESYVVAPSELVLTPFASISDLWSATMPERWLVLGNALLFAPATFFLTLWRPRLPWWIVALGALALSVAIEATQFAVIPNRTAQTDDVIMNTLGALAGIGLAHAAIHLHDRWRRGDSNP